MCLVCGSEEFLVDVCTCCGTVAEFSPACLHQEECATNCRTMLSNVEASGVAKVAFNSSSTMVSICRFAKIGECITHHSRMVIRMLEQMQSIADQLGLAPAVLQLARSRVIQLTRSPHIVHKRRMAVAAAVLYHSALECGARPTLQAVAHAANITHRLLENTMQLVAASRPDGCCQALTVDDHIRRFGGQMGVDRGTVSAATSLGASLGLAQVDCGFKPSSLAAACLYIVADPMRFPRSAIMQATCTSKTTIEACSAYLLERANFRRVMSPKTLSQGTPESCCCDRATPLAEPKWATAAL